MSSTPGKVSPCSKYRIFKSSVPTTLFIIERFTFFCSFLTW